MKVEINQKLIDQVKNQYGFNEIRISHVDQNGFRNVLKIESDKGDYILRIFPSSRSIEQVGRDIEILKFLEEKGFPAPRLISTIDGKFYSRFNQSLAILITFIDGEHPQLDEESAFIMGEMLGTLHNFDCSNYAHKTGWDIKADVEDIDKKWVSGRFKDLSHSEIVPKVIQALKNLPDFDYLPKTIIHTDIHPKNMLKTKDSKYYFIDWDDAGIGVPTIDIGYVLSQVCIGYGAKTTKELKIDLELIASFLKGYKSKRHLSDQEKIMLVKAMQACALAYVVQFWHPRIDYLNWDRYRIEEENKENLQKIIEDNLI